MNSDRAGPISGPLPSTTAGLGTKQIDLSIVLPCLDEAASIVACIQDASRGLQNLGVRGEIIVADNGSHDNSRQLASEAGARVIVTRRRGYGSALRAGIASARGEFVIMADADGSYDLANIAAIWQRLQAGDDLVIGNRLRGTISPGAMPFINRYIGNPLLSGLGRLVTNTRIGDFHSGMRGFHRATVLTLDLQADGMEYASEMIARAAAMNLLCSPLHLVQFV